MKKISKKKAIELSHALYAEVYNEIDGIKKHLTDAILNNHIYLKQLDEFNDSKCTELDLKTRALILDFIETLNFYEESIMSTIREVTETLNPKGD